MKKNGFTIIEVIVAFAITMVVVLFLFQMVLSLKDLYIKDDAFSEMSLRQNGIARMINNDLINSTRGDLVGLENTLSNYATCPGPNCYKCANIQFVTGSKEICVYSKRRVDSNTGENIDENIIVYDDYEFVLPESARIDVARTSFSYTANRVLLIDIPISYSGVDDRYDIKIAYFK